MGTLYKMIEAERVSAVVMSTHGRTRLARWLGGGMAQQVIKHARCSLTPHPLNPPLQPS
ncbi:MAG: universal stress protein [Anaerolineae bacterium]|nr:universal stress protein [Anaerolineae bacterium]